MQELLIYLKARIEWCQQQGRAATNVKDKQAWWAEEAGLVDALRGRPSPSSSPESFGEHLARYQLGLQEGSAIMRLIEPRAEWKAAYEVHHENRHGSKGKNNKMDGPEHGQSAQPSGFMASS
jgi:hypothetical protein